MAPTHSADDPQRQLAHAQVDQSEKAVVSASPGALRASVKLTLHTRQAQRLVKGRTGTRGKPAIIGLLGFAGALRPLWHAARADDPYAEWWLLKVQQAHEQAEAQLAEGCCDVDQRMAQLGAIEIDPATSVSPVSVPLRFGNPVAFRGARLLADFDALVRDILTAGYVGLLTRTEVEAALRHYGRSLRRAFVSPIGYHALGITREDIQQHTPKAAQANQLMGSVPEQVLSLGRTQYD